MSRNVTLDHHDPWDGAHDAPPSVLDRAIALPHLGWRAIVAVTAIVLAVLLRFVGLDRWPLRVGEADIALAAHNLVRGESVPDHFFGAPFTVGWTSLFFFLGGSLDSVGRIATAVAGVLAVLGLLWLSPWIGRNVAVAAAILAALSPTLVATSRQIDGGILLVALSLAVIGASLSARDHDGLGWPIVAGVATALLVLSGPFGVPAALLAWLAVFLLARTDALPGREALLSGLAAGAATVVVISTALFTRPEALTASLGRLFALLWNQHITDIGQHWYMPAINLLLNEPLLLALAAVALFAPAHRTLARATAVWFGVALLAVALLDSVDGPGYAIATLPLVILAGIGAAHVIERLPWSLFRRGPALLYVVTVLLMATALASLLGLVLGGVGDAAGFWLLRFALIVVVAVLPLSIALSAIGARVTGHRLALVFGAGLVLLSALTIRASVLAASDRTGEPGDPLAAGATGSDIGIIVDRLQRVSRDLTADQRTATDPTGGHGLGIAIDEDIAQPFRWYFRDYPNVTIFNPEVEPAPAGAEIVLLDEGVEGQAIAPGFSGQEYLYAWRTPPVYAQPNWAGWLTGVVNPDELRNFAEFLIDREPSQPAGQQQFQLLASPRVAERLFPAAGPFALDDRAGVGAAEGQFNQPRGVAVAGDGTTYVVDARNGRVQKFSPSGEFELAFGRVGSGPGQLGGYTTPGANGASGIAIGDDGAIYVADTWNHRIQVFSPDGEYLRGWGQFFDAADDPTATASQPGAFYGPRGLAFHDGLLYVTDTGNERVQVFTPDGAFVRMFGAPGSGHGALREPVGIAVTEDGTVLVADSHNARIARFTTEGEPLEPWPIETWAGQQFFEPYLAIGQDGAVYATNSATGDVLPISPGGEVGAPLWTAAELKQPYGVAVSPGGNRLLVTDGILNAVVSVPLLPR